MDAKILKISLSNASHADCWPWTKEISGKCSVKSAYRLIVKEKMQIIGESSMETCMKAFWKNLWRMKLPQKIKIFAL